MNKKVRIFFTLLMVLMVANFALASVAMAQTESTASSGQLGGKILGNLELTRRWSDLPDNADPVEIVGLVIRGALSIVAIIFFILIFIAGFRWMMSGGNEETIQTAKKSIQRAIIGVVVIIFSYALTVLIFDIVLGNRSGVVQ
jgi:hypothetical protein